MMLQLSDELFVPIKDGDPMGLSLFKRHYSKYNYKDGRRVNRFIGPGERIALMTQDGLAMFVWRKFINDSGEEGVNCAIFRNEGPHKSSELILDAEKWARTKWPNERMYTYVNAQKIKSTNPGYCFIKAGWRKCGITKVNRLIILEKYHDQ